jgi:macrolide-specific efflux system membrane fusion protein
MRRTILRIFSFIALASLTLAAACSPGATSQQKATPTPLPTPVSASKPTFTVQKGDITAQVQFTARVIPAVQEELFFRADGRVRNVYVRAGDTVTEGMVLADLVSLDSMERQAKQQEIDLRRAEINYEMAWLRQQLASTRTPEWSTGYEIEMKMQAYEVEMAELSLEETQLRAENLGTAITDAQIVSPIDGKVLQISLVEGQEARAFQTYTIVGDDSELEVGTTLTSTQMQVLTEGLPAVIELPNRPGITLTGQVRSLPYPYGTGGGRQTSTSSQESQSAADAATRISLDDSSLAEGFRLGELVSVTVVQEEKKDALWIPPAAIRTYEGRNFVVVQTEDLPKRQDIKIGIRNESQVEILEGLEEGQVVVAP